jgi:hypothetical protein
MRGLSKDPAEDRRVSAPSRSRRGEQCEKHDAEAEQSAYAKGVASLVLDKSWQPKTI